VTKDDGRKEVEKVRRITIMLNAMENKASHFVVPHPSEAVFHLPSFLSFRPLTVSLQGNRNLKGSV
jgi:hypothetical protein